LDEVLVEISTDKVDAEVPSPVTGTIVKVLAGEGETVEVGQALCEIASSNGAAPAAAAEEEEPPAEEQPATGGEVVDIVTPTGGESVTEGTILEWAVKVGDAVEDGQTVVELSTDKVDMELPAPTAGVITEILAEEGDTVSVGQVIARMRAGATAGMPAPTQPAEAPPAVAPPGAGAPPPAAPPQDHKGPPV